MSFSPIPWWWRRFSATCAGRPNHRLFCRHDRFRSGHYASMFSPVQRRRSLAVNW
jgi:hypothetical protein